MKCMTWGVWLLLTFFEVVAAADYLYLAFSIVFARQSWQVHPQIALCLHLRYEFGFLWQSSIFGKNHALNVFRCCMSPDV